MFWWFPTDHNDWELVGECMIGTYLLPVLLGCPYLNPIRCHAPPATTHVNDKLYGFLNIYELVLVRLPLWTSEKVSLGPAIFLHAASNLFTHAFLVGGCNHIDIPNILWKIKQVWNHQPGLNIQMEPPTRFEYTDETGVSYLRAVTVSPALHI